MKKKLSKKEIEKFISFADKSTLTEEEALILGREIRARIAKRQME